MPPAPEPARPAARPILLPALLVAAALAGLALVPVALSADEDPAWGDEPRDVAAWPDGGGFFVQSTRDSSLGKDALVADYDAAAARLLLTLEAQRPDESRLQSTLTILAVSEFRDEDGDGRWDHGEPVVRRIEVPGTPATAGTQGLPGGGWRAFAVHELLTAGSWASPGGAPRLEVDVDALPAASGGIDPSTLRLRLLVSGLEPGNGTHVAVETRVESTQQHDAVNADLARVRDDDFTLAMRWDGEGEVVEGGDPLRVTFLRTAPAAPTSAYEAEVDAAWQPAGDGLLGKASRGSLPLYLGAAFVTLAALAVPAWRRLRAG